MAHQAFPTMRKSYINTPSKDAIYLQHVTTLASRNVLFTVWLTGFRMLKIYRQPSCSGSSDTVTETRILDKTKVKQYYTKHFHAVNRHHFVTVHIFTRPVKLHFFKFHFLYLISILLSLTVENNRPFLLHNRFQNICYRQWRQKNDCRKDLPHS